MALRLSLEQITAWELPAPALFDLAAELGCEAVSLFVEAVNPESAGPPFVGDPALVRECRARSAALGIRVHTIECFALTPETRVEAFVPALEVGARLGGSAATVIVFDPERGRVRDNLAAFTALASAHDLDVNLEFIARSALPDMAATRALVAELDTPRLRLVVDALHWTRSGGTAAELAALDPGLLGAVQLCDGPAEMPLELQLFHEGFLQRMIPGEGDFALDAFVRALPPGRLIGVEAPLQDLAQAGIPAAERARRALAGARRVLEEARYDA